MDYNSKTTLKTLSERLGYSESTISRVLNGKAEKYRISKATADKIIQTVKELNFKPNVLARGLRLNETHTLGLVIPDISNPFFAGIVRSVEHEARNSGYSVILCDTEEDTNIEMDSVDLLRERNVEGLLVAPVGQIADHLEDVYKSGLPIVIIDRYFPDKNLPYVTSDNYRGAFNAVSYLIENGHRRIACIGGLEHTTPNNDRIRGYKDALLKNAISAENFIIVGNKSDRPSAIFALSNLISLGVLKAIEEESLSVPEDISIIAFDEQPFFEHLSAPMSSIKQQRDEIGQIATKIIFKQIKSKKPPDSEGMFIPTKLIKRASVKNIRQSIISENERGTEQDKDKQEIV